MKIFICLQQHPYSCGVLPSVALFVNHCFNVSEVFCGLQIIFDIGNIHPNINLLDTQRSEMHACREMLKAEGYLLSKLHNTWTADLREFGVGNVQRYKMLFELRGMPSWTHGKFLSKKCGLDVDLYSRNMTTCPFIQISRNYLCYCCIMLDQSVDIKQVKFTEVESNDAEFFRWAKQQAKGEFYLPINDKICRYLFLLPKISKLRIQSTGDAARAHVMA